MVTTDEQTGKDAPTMSDGIRNWVMVALTAVFVLLYVASLLGYIRPLTDYGVVTRLEPIVFVIIGYYFGRLPAHSNEQALKKEIDRKTQETRDAQDEARQAQQDKATLAERMKNAVTTLEMDVGQAPPEGAEDVLGQLRGISAELTKHPSVRNAIQILRS
jgi:hypothetical protein